MHIVLMPVLVAVRSKAKVLDSWPLVVDIASIWNFSTIDEES